MSFGATARGAIATAMLIAAPFALSAVAADKPKTVDTPMTKGKHVVGAPKLPASMMPVTKTRGNGPSLRIRNQTNETVALYLSMAGKEKRYELGVIRGQSEYVLSVAPGEYQIIAEARDGHYGPTDLVVMTGETVWNLLPAKQ